MLMRTQRSVLVRKCAHQSVMLQRAAFATEQAAAPLVLVEKQNNYAVVRMNRPPVNSLNTAVRVAIATAIYGTQRCLTIAALVCVFVRS